LQFFFYTHLELLYILLFLRLSYPLLVIWTLVESFEILGILGLKLLAEQFFGLKREARVRSSIWIERWISVPKVVGSTPAERKKVYQR
jgi:hypothetical protein